MPQPEPWAVKLKVAAAPAFGARRTKPRLRWAWVLRIKKKIDAYYAKGFRNVRLPITWTEPVAGVTLVNDANVGDINRQHPRVELIR